MKQFNCLLGDGDGNLQNCHLASVCKDADPTLLHPDRHTNIHTSLFSLPCLLYCTTAHTYNAALTLPHPPITQGREISLS
jgi:hypothetical protein